MEIWKTPISLERLNSRNNTNMIEHLGITYTDVKPTSLTAKMPVDHRTMQPMRLLHGGASCVLAETVGSVASNFCLNQETHFAVGLEINANHIKPVRGGFVHATATSVHIGSKTHIWNIEIKDDLENLVCVSRLTMAILEKK